MHVKEPRRALELQEQGPRLASTLHSGCAPTASCVSASYCLHEGCSGLAWQASAADVLG